MAKSSTMSKNVNAKLDNQPNLAVEILPGKNRVSNQDLTAAEVRYRRDVQVEQGLCHWMEGDIGFAQRFGQSPGNFHVYRPKEGDDEIFELKNKIMTRTKISRITANCSKLLEVSGDDAFNLKYTDMRKAVVRWLDTTVSNSLETYPEPVGFKSSKFHCFRRLDFDPIPCSFEEMEKKCSNVIAPTLRRIKTHRDAFDLRVGSLFVPGSDRKQAVYLWGEYDAGKSFFLNGILYMVCGGKDGVLSIRPSQTQNTHWSQNLMSKPLLIFNEVKPSFVDSDDFKALTGENEIFINPKNKAGFMTELKCMIFLASNHPPEISSDPAIRRRLIDCEITSIDKKDQKSPDVLKMYVKDELQYYLGYCIEKYRELNSNFIPVDPFSLDDHIDNHEIMFERIFYKYFQYDPNLVKPKITLGEFIDKIEPDLRPSHGVDDKSMRAYIKRKFNSHTRDAIWRDGRMQKGLAFITNR